MKGNTLFILLGLLALLSCGEGEEDGQLLDSIEQTWQQAETSLAEAHVRAETLRDSVLMSSEFVKQKYNLLTIRLRDKLDIIPSSPDSALRTMSYFDGRKNKTTLGGVGSLDIDRERAYYYLASAYRDLKDYPRAMSYFLKATDAAEQAGQADTLIWLNALSQLRNLYMLQLNYEEELNVALQSVKLASPSLSKGGENCPPFPGQRNLAWYLMDVASAYEHLNDTLACLLYCDSSYKFIQEEHFPSRYGSILSYVLALYSKYNHYEKTDTLLRHLLQLPKDLRPQNYELCLAKYYEAHNLTDSAIVHYKAYSTTDNVAGRYEASAGLQRCYLRKGVFRQAALWGQHLYETNETIIAQRAFEQTRRARDEYRYLRDQEAERALMQRNEALARRNQRIIFFSIIAGFALLSIAFGMTAYYYYRKKKLMEALTDKERLLEQKARVNKELTRIALMNIATDKADEVLTHFHHIAAGKAKLNDASWDGLMAAMETLYPDFLETVEGRMDKSLPEPLLRTICLLKIGMKPAQIAKVMDAKIQTVWNRVKRAEEICGDLLAVS